MSGTIFYFDKNENVIGIGSFAEAFHNRQKQELAGLITHTIETKFTASSRICSYFGMVDIDDSSIFWMYKVTDRKTTNRGTIELRGIYKLFDDLKHRGYIQDRRPENTTIDIPLLYALDSTGWSIGHNTVTTQTSSHFYYENKLDAFWKILQAYRCEFRPRIIFDKGRIKQQLIDLAPKFAEDNGRIYSFGDRLLTVEEEIVEDEIITAITPLGKGEQISNAEDNESGQAGYGRRIRIDEIVWSTADGDPANKPYGQEYIENKESTAEYGFADGTPRIAVITYSDIEDREELARVAWEDLETLARPKAQLKADVLETRKASLGEYIGIIRDEIGLRYKTRIFSLERNFNDPTDKKFQFGEQIRYDRVSSEIRMRKEYKSALDEVWQLTNQAILSGDGKTTIFHGNDINNPPIANNIGDQWLVTYTHPLTGKHETQSRTWDGTEWILISDTGRAGEAAFVAQQADQKAQEAFTKAEEALNKIEIKLVNDETGKVVGISMINDDGSESILFQIGDDGKVQITEEYFYIKQKLITNEMLAEGISADKITTGTLDAALATIINLNASNMTAGRLTGARFFLDLDTGEMDLGGLLKVDATGAATLSEQAKSELKGDTGEQGPRGLQGQQGADGTDFSWNIYKGGAILDKNQWVKYDADGLNINGEEIFFHTAKKESHIMGYYRLNDYNNILESGKTYTVSFDAKNLRDDQKITFTINGFSVFTYITLEPLEEKRVVITGVRNAEKPMQLQAHNVIKGVNLKFELRNLKIEEGAVENTIFTPHPDELKGDKGSTGPKGDPGADGKDAVIVSATAPTDTTRIWRKSLADNGLYIYLSGAWTRVDQEALTAISDKADISLLQAIREEMEKQNSDSSKLIGDNEMTIGAILEQLAQLKNGDGTGTLDLIQQDMQGLIDREVVWNQDKIDEIIASLQNQYPELFKLTQRVSMDDTGTTFYATDSEGGVMSTATKIKNDGMYIETDGIDVARFTREGTRTRNLQVDGNAYFGNHMVFKSGDDYTIFSHVGNLGQM